MGLTRVLGPAPARVPVIRLGTGEPGLARTIGIHREQVVGIRCYGLPSEGYLRAIRRVGRSVVGVTIGEPVRDVPRLWTNGQNIGVLNGEPSACSCGLWQHWQ